MEVLLTIFVGLNGSLIGHFCQSWWKSYCINHFCWSWW